jgi:anaerobic selenocysteine-containing dehydrogenase
MDDTKKNLEQPSRPIAGVDRRTFLKASGAVAAAAAAAPILFRGSLAKAAPYGQNDPDPTEDDPEVVFIHSVCQMCHSRCGIKAKVKGGLLLKIDGNPWHPNNLEEDERLPYATTPADARNVSGRLCPKGQAGVQTLYDPFRIQHPLRRVGARGSGKWQTITWEEAFSEIAARINALIPFAIRTAQLIDPASPDLGPIANQLVYSPGRTIEGGFTDRIFKNGFGTQNARLDHTSICETSHHVANQIITYDHVNNAKGPNHFKPDLENAAYTIVFGANPLEANFPMLALSRKLMDMKAAGGKLVVVDPRFSNSAAKADQWVPVRPGGDAALGLGMARVILAAGLHNAAYLKNANKAAATAGGEPTFTDSTWLVITQAGHPNQGKFLTAAEAGVAAPLDAANPVCIAAGTATPSEAAIKGTSPPAAVGELDPLDSGQRYVTVNSIQCRSAFGLYSDRVMEQSLHQYAVICGVDEATITQLATDFTAYGRKASAWTYRGVVQHANGTYAHLAVKTLNLLIGNIDCKGGLAKGGSVYAEGKATGGVDTGVVPGAVTPSGVRLDRANATYAATKSYFAGYPARRQWFPFAYNGNYQEIIPSIQDGYPYPAKVLITYWNAIPYSVPGARAVWEQTVADEVRLPLFVAISPVMGEVPAWADYVLPDTTYLEKWAFGGGTPTILTAFQSFQQPVVGKLDGATIGGTGSWTFDPTAPNDYTPLLPDTKQLADICIGLAQAISPSFPGVGTDALGAGNHVNRAWDFFRHQLSNLTITSGASVADIVAKGGAFEDPGNGYDGTNPNLLKSKYGGVLHFYSPQLAVAVDSITGLKYDGLPKYEPPMHADGTPVDDPLFPFHLITYKSVLHGQARTAVNPWLMTMCPENFVELATPDARSLGVETGDRVLVTSASNQGGVIGRARVTEGLRPGVVAISHHFGHWELSSRPFLQDGTPTPFDPSRGAGLTANPIMRLDDVLGNVSLQDRLGGSVAFNDTKVAVTRVTE